VAGLSDANVAVAITAFHDKIKAYAGNADKGKILQHRPIEKLIRALACTKLAAEDAIIGMCVMGARPGADYDVHLRAYGI
jgi:choline dehydrogenase-like flavoprotein